VPQQQQQQQQQYEAEAWRPVPDDDDRGGDRVTERPMTEAEPAVARRTLLHADQRQRKTVIQVV